VIAALYGFEVNMQVDKLINTVIDDLKKVSESKPNERLPKEEQIRSCIFSALKNKFDYVCCERNYQSVDNGKNIECDIWAANSGEQPVWMEIKRCWHLSSWVNKPGEQLKSWEADLNKLSTVDINSKRYFFLVGVFDSEPNRDDSKKNKVILNIQNTQPQNLCFERYSSYFWRESSISNIAVWVWCWNSGEVITI
ncbi:hypothetical protein, partial [Aliivibrio fischeri]|uniref:hypothetical protein n=1 Tax=Aliivibrio fischeri TaxID=668 RepID=UPI00159ED246